MAGIELVDGRPVCAACRQPVDPTAFVCLNCGAGLQSGTASGTAGRENEAGPPPSAPNDVLPPPPFRTQPPPPQGRPVFVTPPPAPPPPPGGSPVPAPPPPFLRAPQPLSSPSQAPPSPNPWAPASGGGAAPDGATGTSPTDSQTIHLQLPLVRPAGDPPVDREPVAAPEPPDSGDERTIIVERRPRAEWALRLASGQRVPVDGPLLLGRNPSAAAGPPGGRLVVISDPTRTVSRSHIVVEPRPGAGIVVRDVSSANGIVLVVGGVESEVEANGAVRIAARSTIVLGRYRIEVEPA